MKHIGLRASLLLILMLTLLLAALSGCAKDKDTYYQVSFDTQGGTAVASASVKAGTPAARPADPTREGADFIGWYLNGAEYDFSAPVNGNITLTARWEYYCTVVFQAADGTVLKTETVKEGSSATAPEAPARTGYQFDGWDKAFDSVTSDLTVKAVYTRVFIVSFVDHDGTVLHTETVPIGGSATAPADPVRDGHTFAGWDKAFDSVTADLTVTATYRMNPATTYTVTFLDHDGTELKVQTVAEGEAATAPSDPVRDGHTFAGWDKAFDSVTADLTVTATYRMNPATTYTVTFLDHDGTELKVQTVAEGGSATAPAAPARLGYRFTGWDKAFDNVTADLTVTAQYAAVPAYTVTFLDYDGTELKVQRVDEGSGATAPAAPSRPGYQFTGWDKAFDDVTADLTVTAQYGPITHFVTFDSNGGSSVASATVADGETVAEPAAPTHLGYIFIEWQLNGVKYDFTTPVTRDITLVARYESDGTIPATTNTDVELWPRELEVWTDLTLQLNVRPAGVRLRFLENSTAAFEFASTDPTLVSVTNDGTFTSYGTTGSAVIYARCTAAGSYSDGSRTYSVAVGDVLNCVTVKVVERDEFRRLADSDPDQQLNLPITDTPRINNADFIEYPDGDYGAASIAMWYGGATSVFTMSADDNITTDFPQWTAWLEEYHIPLTFIVHANYFAECGDVWEEQYAHGHSAQSHGATHLNGDIRYTSTAEFWYDQYMGMKYMNMSGAGQSLIIGYPYGGNYAEISRLLYIGGRGGSLMNDSDDIDYNMIHSYSGFPTNLAELLAGMFATETTSQWLSVHYHNIGGGQATVVANYDKLKPYIDSGRLWAANIADAAQYGQERDTATLTVTSANADTVTFTLTDRMNDLMFYHPLSVRIKVDASWQHARAYQGGGEIPAKVVTHEGETYLVVDAVPDRGEITVARTEISGLSQQDGMIRFTPSDASNYSDRALTLSFDVDPTAWHYVYATQGGRVLDAWVDTKVGFTKLYVTCEADGTEVVLVPVTDQFDSRTEYTMTEIYERRMPTRIGKTVTIGTPEELRMFAEYINEGNPCTGVTFRLTSDLDMTGVEYRPAGWAMLYESSSTVREYRPFCGIFDGAGHRVYNLELHDNRFDTGIFGHTDGATIRDLHVEGNISGSKRVGGLVGYALKTNIFSCSFEGTVINRGMYGYKNSGSYTGGLVGHMIDGTIEHSTVDAHINAYAELTTAADKTLGNRAGGILGCAQNTITLNNCIFYGSVTAHAASDGTGGQYVGGMLGTTDNVSSAATVQMVNCTVYGDVTGTEYVGGITGQIYSNSSGRNNYVYNCAVYGTVKGSEHVGGIVGIQHTNAATQIVNCLAAGRVEAPSEAQYVGAVVGEFRTGSNLPILNAYYISSVNPGMLPCVGTVGGSVAVKYTCTEVTDLAVALTALTEAATGSGYYPWQLTDGELTPSYTAVYQVTFLDKDGAVLSLQSIPTGLAATAPAAPVFQGFEFKGWNKTFDAVTEDMTVTALYDEVTVHTVTFKGQNGEGVLKTEQVNDGLAATAPAAPAVEGYRFDRWSVSFDNVTSDLEVVALYVKTYDVTFLYEDGSVYKVITVDDGAAVTPPRGPVVEGKMFDGWVGLPAVITADTTVNPTYSVRPPIAASEYKILQWTIGGNAQWLQNGLENMSAAIAESGADIIVVSGVDSATMQKIPLPRGYSVATHGGGTGETVFKNNGSGFAIFYRTDKFSVAGDIATYQVEYKFGALILPLVTPEGRTLTVGGIWKGYASWAQVSAADADKFFGWLDETLGDGVDCAVLSVHVAGPDQAATEGWQSTFARSSANSAYSYSCNTGRYAMKGDDAGRETNKHADYIITYSKGAPTVILSAPAVLQSSADTDTFPMTQGLNPAFYCSATLSTVSVGATD